MIELLKSAFRNFGRKRLRTFLTISGIVVGVASVTLIGNISRCGISALNTEFKNLGLDGLSISASAQAQNVTLNSEELSIIRSNSQVEQAMPILFQNMQISARDQSEQALVWGIDAKANQVISLQVLHGRSIQVSDVKSSSNVCLVDESFSQKSYHRNNIVGKTISIFYNGIEEEFEVVGVVKTGSGLLQNLIGDYVPTFIYIPYTSLQNLCGKNSFDQIAVKVKNGENLDEVGQNLVTQLSRNVGLKDSFISSDLTKQKDSLNNILNIIMLILSAVGAISLLVANLSIMIVMLVSVNERTREIGIKKSIGASKNAILSEFLIESTLLVFIGCFVGIVLGYLISYIGAAFIGVFISIQTDLIIYTIFFSLLTGIIFGVYPAWKASQLSPVIALRNE